MTGLGSLLAVAEPHVAIGDCERVRNVIGQPVNVITSLAMSGIGLGLVVAARGWAGADRRRALRLVGVTLVATGLGSAAFHGPGGSLAHVAHDASITALPLVFAVTLAGAGSRVDPLVPYAIGLTAIVVARLATPAAFTVSTGLAVIALVVTLAVTVGRGRRAGAIDPAWLATAVGLLVAGGLLHAWSRTGQVLCHPDSPLQGHALWHLVAALAVVAAARSFGLVPPRSGAGTDR